jgi:nucleoside-diphosphate-sugar epimerase
LRTLFTARKAAVVCNTRWPLWHPTQLIVRNLYSFLKKSPQIEKVFLVNTHPQAKRLNFRRPFKSIADIKEEIDLLFIASPSGLVPDAVKDAVDYIKSLLPGANITLEPGSVGMGFKYDTTPIKEEIGYSPQWSMEEGLKDSLNFVRQYHGLPPI